MRLTKWFSRLFDRRNPRLFVVLCDNIDWIQIKSLFHPLCSTFSMRVVSGSKTLKHEPSVFDTVCRIDGKNMEYLRVGVSGGVSSNCDATMKGCVNSEEWCVNLHRAMDDVVVHIDWRDLTTRDATRQLSAAVYQLFLLARGPWFRNDDVSADTDIVAFGEFCRLFWRHGWTQLHGVTLRGLTNSYRMHEGECVEYENTPSLGVLPNDRIRELSRGAIFEERSDLIRFLNQSPDEIAVHGLYHTDYSVMNAVEQHAEMSEALSILRRLFPEKSIQWFIAPFNRTNIETYKVAESLGLKVLALDGVHLEESLHRVYFEPRTWYRYHHHRFYPESTFPYWQLSLAGLVAAFERNAQFALPTWYNSSVHDCEL